MTLTLFSWGYWGWGNATHKFLEMVDSVENARKFNPPVFIDIRFSRAVRAKGFQGSSFEKIVGADRYIWMKSLGNESHKNKGEVNIHEPEAIKNLLDLAKKYKNENRRIIFFCSCEYPPECHRAKIAELAIEEAESRKELINIIEWPGEKAKRVNISSIKKLTPTRLFLERYKLYEIGSIPWGSSIKIKKKKVFTGPAKYSNSDHDWYLPLLTKGKAKRLGI